MKISHSNAVTRISMRCYWRVIAGLQQAGLGANGEGIILHVTMWLLARTWFQKATWIMTLPYQNVSLTDNFKFSKGEKFKMEAVRLVRCGQSIAAVAQTLGIADQTLHN